jgi:hypothetical protein
MNAVSNSTEVQKLFEKAAAHLIWQALIEKPSGVFQAMCHYEKRLIILNPQVSDVILAATIIFELTNAASERQMLEIHQAALEGKISRELFAKEIERVEHQGVLLHKKIVAAGMANLRWDPEMDIYKDVETDFEKYWLKIKDTSHSGEYRKYWDKRIKPKLTAQKAENG